MSFSRSSHLTLSSSLSTSNRRKSAYPQMPTSQSKRSRTMVPQPQKRLFTPRQRLRRKRQKRSELSTCYETFAMLPSVHSQHASQPSCSLYKAYIYDCVRLEHTYRKSSTVTSRSTTPFSAIYKTSSTSSPTFPHHQHQDRTARIKSRTAS